MNLGEALKAELDRKYGRYWGVTRPADSIQGRVSRMARLEREHGSPAAAARAVGVTPGTWVRWKRPGIQAPSKASLRKLVDAYQAAIDPAKQRAILRLARAIARVSAVIRWGDSNTKYNKLNGGYRTTTLDPINMRVLITPWQAGDLTELALQFETAVSRHYARLTDTGEPDIAFEGNNVEVTL